MNKIEKDTENAIKIIKIVNNYFNIHNETKSRNIAFMLPRQISQYFVRRKLGLSYKLMASIFEIKQHGTVMSNIKKIDDFSNNDIEISLYVKELELILRKDVEIMMYERTLSNVEILTSINKILDVKSVYDLKKIKEILLDYNENNK